MAKFQKTIKHVYCFTDEFLKDKSPKKDVELLKPFKRGEAGAEENVKKWVNEILQSNEKSKAVKCIKVKDSDTFNGNYPSLPYVVWDLVCVSDDKAAFDFVIDKIGEYLDKVEGRK